MGGRPYDVLTLFKPFEKVPCHRGPTSKKSLVFGTAAPKELIVTLQGYNPADSPVIHAVLMDSPPIGTPVGIEQDESLSRHSTSCA